MMGFNKMRFGAAPAQWPMHWPVQWAAEILDKISAIWPDNMASRRAAINVFQGLENPMKKLTQFVLDMMGSNETDTGVDDAGNSERVETLIEKAMEQLTKASGNARRHGKSSSSGTPAQELAMACRPFRF